MRSEIQSQQVFQANCTSLQLRFNHPKRVWNLIESAVNNPKTLNDYSGVILDICWMSIKSSDRKIILGGNGVEFSVIITGADEKPSRKENGMPIYRLYSICGAMDFDDPTPVITISFPDED